MKRKDVTKEKVIQLYQRFMELTSEERQGRPVHIPFTKFKGLSLLDIVMLKFALPKEQAKEIIRQALHTVPVKRGILVFDQPLKKDTKKDITEILKEF